MGVLVCCYSDILAFTTPDRFDGKFFPWLVVACVEEATKTPHRYVSMLYAPSVYLLSLSFDIRLWVTAVEFPSGTFFFSLIRILSVYWFSDRSRGRI